MSLRSRKFIGSIGGVNTANSDFVSAESGVSVYVCRPGAASLATVTISTAQGLDVDNDSLKVGDEVRVLESDGTLSSVVFTVGSVTRSYSASLGGSYQFYTIGFSAATGGGTYAVTAGDRLVRADPTDTINHLQITPNGNNSVTNQLLQPLTTDSEGKYWFYSNAESCDIYITGGNVDAGWYLTDVTLWPSEITLHGRHDTGVVANTDISIDNDVSVVQIATNTNPIDSIASAVPGRVVFFQGTVDWSYTTQSAAGADKIVVSAGAPASVSVDANDVVAFVGNRSSSVNYWSPVRLTGVSLDDVTDVSAGSAASGDILTYNGSAWVAGSTAGTSANPVSEFIVDSGGVQILDASGDAASLAFSGTADRTVTFPDATGTVVLTGATQVITGSTTFDDDAWAVRDPVDTTKQARLDVGGVTSGNTRVLTVPDKDITLADAADYPDFNITFVANNSLLQYQSSTGEWIDARVIASATEPLLGLFVQGTGGLLLSDIANSTAIGVVVIGSVPTTRQLNLRGGVASGSYIVTSDRLIQTANVNLGASGTSGGGVGWGTFMTAGINGVTALYTPNGCTISRVTYEISREDVGTSAGGDLELQLYWQATSNSYGTSTPPASGTAILTNSIAIPSSSGAIGAQGSLTGGLIDDSTIPADSFVYVGLAAGTTLPSINMDARFSVQYTEVQS